MAKKHLIWLCVTVVVIITCFVWLTQSVQWRSYIDAEQQEAILDEDDQYHIADKAKQLEITALIPPSETFNHIIEQLSLTDPIEVNVNYFDTSEFSFQTYKNYLLTEDRGDIHLLPNEWILPLAVEGFFVPLDRVVTSEYVEEQTTSLIESMKWNGNIWAAPYELDPYVVIPHQQLHDLIKESEKSDNHLVVKQTLEGIPTETLPTSILQLPAEEQINESSPEQENDIFNIIQSTASPKKLVNSEHDNISLLFHFIHYVDQAGIHSGQQLSEKQADILNMLYHDPTLVVEKSIDELVEGLEDNEPLPLFLVIKWSDLTKHAEFIKTYYDLSRAEVPIYWTNGYSFVIRHQSKERQVAGQWLEALNRKMSEQHIINVGMPLQKNNQRKLYAAWQQTITSQYNELFSSSALMQVSPLWPNMYENLERQWKLQTSLKEKIAYWLAQRTN